MEHDSPKHKKSHFNHRRLLFANSRANSRSRSRFSKEHPNDIEHCHMHHWTNVDEPSSVISERCQRARINSAIFVSSEGKGFDSIEFIRRYGSQSVLCRKAKSAENITSERNRRFSTNKDWESEDRDPTKDNNHTNDSNNRNYLGDNIELVECHLEPSSLLQQQQPTTISSSSATASTNKNPTIAKKPPKLNNLPTLSVSGPSPSHEQEDFL